MESKPFPVETTCVLNGIKEFGENLKSKCEHTIHDALGLPSIEIKEVARVGDHDGKPGIVKLETRSLNDKINILRNKGKLRDHECCSSFRYLRRLFYPG